MWKRDVRVVKKCAPDPQKWGKISERETVIADDVPRRPRRQQLLAPERACAVALVWGGMRWGKCWRCGTAMSILNKGTSEAGEALEEMYGAWCVLQAAEVKAGQGEITLRKNAIEAWRVYLRQLLEPLVKVGAGKLLADALLFANWTVCAAAKKRRVIVLGQDSREHRDA